MSKRYAILFSAEDYLDAPRTPFCHADRELLARALTELCDYAVNDIVSIGLATDGSDQVASVMNRLTEIRDRLQSGDTMLFYYAGHGVSINDEPYLVLPATDRASIEKTSIAIRDISDKLRIDGVQCFRIFDSCHSGFDVRDSELHAESLMRGVVKRVADGWVTLAACAPDEVCYSSSEEGHGVFTSRLVQAIREVEEGKNVAPELLKVRVCELVEEWGARSGCFQTPTLIAAIRGNISLAKRRAVVQREDNVPQESTPVQSPAEVRARLIELQGDAPPASGNYWKRFQAVSEVLHEELDFHRDLVKEYADSLDEVRVTRVEAVRDSLEEEVVDLIYKKGWRPLHHVSRKTIVERTQLGAVLAWNQFRERRIERELTQDYEQPESVVYSGFSPNAAFPGLKIIHYVCPLQTRFLLYSKVEVSRVLTVEGTGRSHAWYRIVDTEDVESARKHAIAVLQRAADMFREACEANIEYLEREQGG